MEEDRGEKYVCRLCNKGFLSGRILGGHMRSHMGAKSVGKEEDKAKQMQSNGSSHGLRENPKKSWKISDSEFECNKCGKKFESPRALFGHMRHHSSKEREGTECAECGRGFRNLRALRTHRRSHSVKSVGEFEDSGGGSSQNLAFESLTVKRKRSRTIRYRITPSSSVSGLNESFSVSQTEEEEEEEVALCLMMLSSGVRDSDRFSSVNESEIDDDHNEFFKMKKPREEISSSVLLVPSVEFLEEKVETEVEKGIISDAGFEFRAIEVKSIEGFGSIKSSSFKDHNFNDAEKENLYICKTCNKTFSSYQALGGHQTIHRSSNKSWIESKIDDSVEKIQAFGANSTEFEAGSKFMKLGCTEPHQTVHRSSNKRWIESKTDDSVEKIQSFSVNCTEFEAGYKFMKLGCTEPHQTIHRSSDKRWIKSKTDDSVEKIQSFSVNSTEFEAGSKFMKLGCTELYQCPICLKTFESGQALGGHKRAHIKEKQQEFPDNALDLNLPAMFTEEADTDTDLQFRSFWVRNDSNLEPMIGLVAN